VNTTAGKLNVLLVEDNLGDARLLRHFLIEGAAETFELEHVELLSAALDRLAKGGIVLVLLDLTLPDSMGLETFAAVQRAAPQTPIIVLSGRDDESLAMKTVHAGAQDYLVKGQVDSRLLVRAMRYALERKRAEEALAHERDLLHTLLENLPDRIYFKDGQSRFMRISRAVADQFKLGHPREAVGKTDFDFFTLEHAQAALEDEQQVMRTGDAMLGKVEKETLPSGLVTWALTSKMPLKDKEGRVIGNFGISRDITAIKRIEDQLATERNLLRNLIDNLPDYIHVKDAKCRLVIDNIAHRRFLGANSPEEIVGKTVDDFFPPELAAQYTRDDQTVIETGLPLLNREEPVVDRFGNRRWHSMTKVPLRDSSGGIMGLVGIGRDITERKLAEQELQKANHELAQSKTELENVFTDLQKSHEELKSAQFQLIQAEKMQSVGRLAAGVAHEVKNPLAILAMGIDYMSKNLVSPDENLAQILADMNDALKRADSIILGLLDFSLPGALKLGLEDVSAILDQSVGLVRHEMANSHIALKRALATDLPAIRVDKNKLKQAFVNILTNALHAMPEGGTISARTYSRKLELGEIDHDAGSRMADRFRPGETVIVAEIEDTGPGIPADKLAKVFDPFFTTKPTGKGTGLGLTVTKKIIELHGGSIEIGNCQSGGACVRIMLKV
jgi:PAS domain S-box-containing protein